MERTIDGLREVFANGESMSHFEKIRMFSFLALTPALPRSGKEQAHLDLLVAHKMITLPEVS